MGSGSLTLVRWRASFRSHDRTSMGSPSSSEGRHVTGYRNRLPRITGRWGLQRDLLSRYTLISIMVVTKGEGGHDKNNKCLGEWGEARALKIC